MTYLKFIKIKNNSRQVTKYELIGGFHARNDMKLYSLGRTKLKYLKPNFCDLLAQKVVNEEFPCEMSGVQIQYAGIFNLVK